MRDLEREAAVGDKEAGSRLLLERVRSGETSLQRLELASFLGEESARVALGEEKRARESEIDTRQKLNEWVRTLLDQGDKESAVRIAVTAAREVIDYWNDTVDKSPRLAIESAENWILSPSDQTVAKAQEMAGMASDAIDYLDHGEHEGHAVAAASNCAYSAYVAQDKSKGGAAMTVYSAYDAQVSSGKSEQETANKMYEIIRNNLLPWALGQGDPVKERVEG